MVNKSISKKWIFPILFFVVFAVTICFSFVATATEATTSTDECNNDVKIDKNVTNSNSNMSVNASAFIGGYETKYLIYQNEWRPDWSHVVKVGEYAEDFGFAVEKSSQGHTHTTTEISAAPATQKEAGHKAYYRCTRCGKFFEDKAGTTEISNLEKWLKGPGKTDDSWEVQFNNYKLEQIVILKSMKKSGDSKAVTDLIDGVIKDIEESEYIADVDLNQNKARITMMVEETQKAIDNLRVILIGDPFLL